MPKIKMCLNQKCEKKEGCLRFQATPSNFQTYVMYNRDGGHCEHFIAMGMALEDIKTFVD